MGRTLTIVAAPPDDKEYPKNNGIEEVLEKLIPFQSESYKVARAASVSDIRKVLRTDLTENGPPELVQIVGHGRPGILFLGMTWTNTIHGSGGTYVLDGNPYDYGVLFHCVKSPTRVMLLGCEVGLMTTVGTSEIADGATLLFDLCRMWECEVSAPQDLVLPGDFVNGLYNSKGLVVASDMGVETPAQPKDKAAARPRGVGAPRL